MSAKNLTVAAFPSAPKVMAALDRLAVEITGAKTLKQLDDIADQAAGLQRRYRPVKEIADRAGEVWVEAEVKLGEELRSVKQQVGLAKGARGNPGGQGAKVVRSQKGTTQATLAEIGVTKKRSALAQRIAAVPKAKRRAIIEDLKAASKPINTNTVLAAERQEAKKEKQKQVMAAVFSADGPFDVVVIDPPWKVENIDREVRPNQDAFAYPTMTEDEIAKLWLKEIAPRLKADCHLFMWTTHKWLPTALELLKPFGFRYVLTMVWHKSGGMQPVGLPQYNCEFVVYARKGAPMFGDTKDFNCCFDGDRREHSRKPDKFYDTVRRVTGGSRIDVFSREAREGFAQFGNENAKFTQASEAAE